jgi:chromosome segregation ATPase
MASGLAATLPVMAHPSDFEVRLSALETQVSKLAERVQHSEQDAAAARVLAGGADRDVEQIRGEIRDFRQATTSSFNAMREDLTDLREDLTDLRADLTDLRARVESGFTQVDRGFAEMRGRLDGTAAGLAQIAGLLSTLLSQHGEHQDDQ